jgi:hypothetical protein
MLKFFRIPFATSGDRAASPDALVLGHCARVFYERTGRVSPIHLALAQIIAAEVPA